MSPPSKTSIMLVNGRYFDHLAPDASAIDLDVLEHGLDVPRFNNQTRRPITTQEHSLRVRRLAADLWGSGAVDAGLVDTARDYRDLKLWALLHDAHEALVPWGDCLGPGKTPEMKAVEAEVDVVICIALGLDPDLVVEQASIVKIADAIALYFESIMWQPGASDWAPDVLGHIGYGPNPDKWLPLINPRPGESWRDEVEELLGKPRA